MFTWLVAKIVPRMPTGLVRAVAQRYVAGEDMEAAIAKVRVLNHASMEATMDILGEDAESDEDADSAATAYLALLERIQETGVRSTVSLKLTHLGVRIDVDRAERRLHGILQAARERGNFVTIDMEDSSLTQTTLDIFARTRKEWDNVGAVVQAYLRRTATDAERLARIGAHVRICKGIYRESRQIAYQSKEAIRRSYLAAAKTLLSADHTYVALATHDRKLVKRLLRLLAELHTPRERVEFQVLLGVPVDDLVREIRRQGYGVRVYVPFGEDWYPYAIRRLKENPRLAGYAMKHLFHRGGTHEG